MSCVKWLVFAALSVPSLLSAATVTELLQAVNESLDAADLNEPGNTKRAEAIADLVKEDLGLSPVDALDLRLALAEAWAGAGRPDETVTTLTPLFAVKGASAAQRERAGLAWVAAWQVRVRQAEKPAEVPSVLVQLAGFGELGAKAVARAHTAEAERLLALKTTDKAIEHFDQALELLKPAPAAERVPVYSLRLLAMEQAGQKGDDIQAWLHDRAADPAIAQILASALTSGQKLVGQLAPPLKAKRLDGKPGEIELASFKGKPVLLDFFATWCKPCEAVAPAVAKFSAWGAPKGLVTIGVSLDTKDTVANLGAFIVKHGIAYPIIGDALGWDSELDDAFHVESIPNLILIAPDGKVAAVDLIGGSVEETLKNLQNAAQPYLGGPAPGAGVPAAGGDGGEVIP